MVTLVGIRLPRAPTFHSTLTGNGNKGFTLSAYLDAPIFKLGQLRCSSYVAWDAVELPGPLGGPCHGLGSATQNE